MLFVGTAALAQKESSSKPNTSVIQKQRPNYQLKAKLKAESTQYTTTLSDAASSNQAFTTIGRVEYQYKSRFQYHLDATVGSNVTLGTSHFAVTELSTSYQPSKNTSISLGRKLEFWSQIDQDWQLGMWQPTFGQLDALRPLNQGLTGLFYKQKYGVHELLLFGSPLFIPSMGPDVKEKDGNLVSDSRWYKQPSSTFPFQGKNVNILYSLDLSQVPDLVNNPGGGIRYRIGREKGLWAAANYSSKPINSLLLKYKALLRTPEFETKGEVTVSPVVGYQQLRGGDVGYNFESASFGSSYLEDSPNKITADEGWSQQQPTPFQAYSLFVEGELAPFKWLQPVHLHLSYLRVSGGKIQDYDFKGVEQGAIFENRFVFTNALQVKGIWDFYLFKRKITSQLKYLREFDQQGDLLSASFDFQASSNWLFTFGADVLSVDDQASNDTTFLNQFRANDRYFGGLGYVF